MSQIVSGPLSVAAGVEPVPEHAIATSETTIPMAVTNSFLGFISL
jgi:hypothetical protein